MDKNCHNVSVVSVHTVYLGRKLCCNIDTSNHIIMLYPNDDKCSLFYHTADILCVGKYLQKRDFVIIAEWSYIS